MIRIFATIPDNGTLYIPAPARGIVAQAVAVYQSNVVEPDDTIIISRDTTAVNTITATDAAGFTREVGVPDTTNKDLIFDPDHATDVNTVIKVVSSGAAGVAILMIEFDNYAVIEEESVEA